MPRLRLVLEYDGAAFQGWQLQPNGPTVQAALEDALLKLGGSAVRVIGASRTDSGVHARGQVAHCDVALEAEGGGWRKSLNAVLVPGVAVLRVDPVPETFHARRDALAKRYRYRVLNRPAGSPLRVGQTWHVRRRLDVGAMREAAAQLVGHHDFSAFRGAPGGPATDERTERTLDRLDVVVLRDEVQLWAEGRSFLRYMVRNLAGTLVEIGLGRRPPSVAGEILRSRDRTQASATAPARGLCLEAIRYALFPWPDLRTRPAELAPSDSEEGESSLDP